MSPAGTSPPALVRARTVRGRNRGPRASSRPWIMTPCLRAPHPRVLALLLGCSVAACNPGEPQDSSGGTGSTTSDDSGPSTGPSSTSASSSLDGTTTITELSARFAKHTLRFSQITFEPGTASNN